MGGELGYELGHILADHARIDLRVALRDRGTELVHGGELWWQKLPDERAHLVEPEIHFVFSGEEHGAIGERLEDHLRIRNR